MVPGPFRPDKTTANWKTPKLSASSAGHAPDLETHHDKMPALSPQSGPVQRGRPIIGVADFVGNHNLRRDAHCNSYPSCFGISIKHIRVRATSSCGIPW